MRTCTHETLWSWDEIEGVLEIKAFRGPAWGSRVGVRVMSWLDDASDLTDLKDFLGGAVGRLVGLLG